MKHAQASNLRQMLRNDNMGHTAPQVNVSYIKLLSCSKCGSGWGEP